MCGIVGVWQRDGAPADARSVQRAADTIRHRGPDDEGCVVISTATGHWRDDCEAAEPGGAPFDLAFGFRRLAILDLTRAGHQPMRDPSGTFWIVFNGEIYNYIELRQELCAAGYRFQSGTDTEVILNAYAHWGDDCVNRFNGMWAFAIWDGRCRRLFCARDRFGIKPFYYQVDDRRLVFGSEIKALIAAARLNPRPNDSMVADYLVTGLVDHTLETFYSGIRQLPAAHTLAIDGRSVRLNRYWRLQASADPRPAAALRAEFAERFEDAIRIHLRSDVPIGTCLSGGLDSSAIVGVVDRLLQSASSEEVKQLGPRQLTFTSCFTDPRYDERKYAEAVLGRTGAEANFTFPQAEEIPDLLPKLLWHQDEPCATSSIFAQWCVMRAAAERGVKVLLDGQGGDELLAGYHTYFGHYFAELLRTGRLTTLWHEMQAYTRTHRAPWSTAMARLLEPLLPSSVRRLTRRALKEGSPEVRPEVRALATGEIVPVTGDRDMLVGRLRSMLETVSLPALLRYEDRNSMAFSLEARVPFLDSRLVEFAFSLPHEARISDGRTKAILRDALSDTLPPTVRDRQDKMGFVTPESEWFAGPLRSWAHDIVHSTEFAQRAYWDAAVARRMLADFGEGRKESASRIWRWVSLELWLRQLERSDWQFAA